VRAALLALCLIPCVVGSAEGVEQDKQQHLVVSALLGVVATTALEDTRHPVLYGAAVASIPGVLKEVYDARHPGAHTASAADLAADVIGAVTGAWLGHNAALHVGKRRVEVVLQGRF